MCENLRKKAVAVMRLEEFVFNDNVITELSDSMRNNTLPHAIIIDGAKGTGKKTLANIIACYSVCTGNERPCGNCPACLKAQHNSHPDIFIADGTQSGGLSVDVIRNIRSDAYIMPNEAATKVYLLLDCDKMLAPAQNAFLKVLEEPPSNVRFVMTVSSANMLLQTVRSRSRLYSLYPAPPEQAAEYVAKLFPDEDYNNILHTAQLCDGNIGKTIETIQNGGQEASKLADDIFRAVFFGKEYDVLVLTNKLSAGRPFAASVLEFLSENAAECVKAAVGAETSSAIAKECAQSMTKAKILRIAENIDRAKSVLGTNINLNFFGTWLSSVLKV